MSPRQSDGILSRQTRSTPWTLSVCTYLPTVQSTAYMAVGTGAAVDIEYLMFGF